MSAITDCYRAGHVRFPRSVRLGALNLPQLGDLDFRSAAAGLCGELASPLGRTAGNMPRSLVTAHPESWGENRLLERAARRRELAAPEDARVGATR